MTARAVRALPALAAALAATPYTGCINLELLTRDDTVPPAQFLTKVFDKAQWIASLVQTHRHKEGQA